MTTITYENLFPVLGVIIRELKEGASIEIRDGVIETSRVVGEVRFGEYGDGPYYPEDIDKMSPEEAQALWYNGYGEPMYHFERAKAKSDDVLAAFQAELEFAKFYKFDPAITNIPIAELEARL